MFEAPEVQSHTAISRIELKYPLPEEALGDAVAELKAMLPVMRYNPDEEWSSLRTTYLDTRDYQCYQEYLQDVPVRKKIRIRQYGVNGNFDEICWVELKVKNHNVSIKRRFRCPINDVNDLIRGEDVYDRVVEVNDEDVEQTYGVIRSMILEQALLPVVRVDYQRLAFHYPENEGVRLTLDHRVCFRAADEDRTGELKGLIVEVKHDGTKPAWLRSLRERLGMKRVTRFSKFGRSITQLNKLMEQQGPM